MVYNVGLNTEVIFRFDVASSAVLEVSLAACFETTCRLKELMVFKKYGLQPSAIV